ncbi:LLM class flavin-dependent oxidoreductase [Mesorhizobium sp. YR577]|uniref:LLM class flavin-dependent oxidoreductase n=1 Tax=Mesorhizobium sp. YR577 TaxID=1884373 RepID=UPI000B8A5BB3|nr:LLM class flavin-dependent oxidoreductase [Mesorhizobium sp. YR577]
MLGISFSPGGGPSAALDFGLFAQLVRKAEANALDMVVLADAAPFEATTLVAALATVTSRIGLVATASTVAHQPYNLARRFASLDVISHGRAGWKASMTQNTREAANFSRPDGFSPDAFRRRTEEYIDIVQGLWKGWDADALLFDKSAGRFHDPEKMHLLDHKGEFFSVRGPLNVARSPQDTPVLVMSGLSASDLDLAARTADVVLTDEASPERAKAFHGDLAARVAARGRDANAVKIFLTLELSGTPAETADRLEAQFRTGDCHGFNIVLPPQMAALDGFVSDVLPLLRQRGLARHDYGGAMLRANLGLAAGGAS